MTESNHQNQRYWERVPVEGPIWRPKELCKRLGVSRSQAYQMIADGNLPPFIKLSDRASGMPESWLAAFLEKQAQKSIRARREDNVTKGLG